MAGGWLGRRTWSWSRGWRCKRGCELERSRQRQRQRLDFSVVGQLEIIVVCLCAFFALIREQQIWRFEQQRLNLDLFFHCERANCVVVRVSSVLEKKLLFTRFANSNARTRSEEIDFVS